MPSPSVYDHYSSTDTDSVDGVYRVVGISEEGVTLLRVGDADGQRVNTGKIITVSYDDLNGFDPAENPDGNRPLGDAVKSKAEMVYWTLRVFVQQLAAHPLMALLAAAVLVVGSFGEEFISLPDSIFGILIIGGSLGLAYIGSGRL